MRLLWRTTSRDRSAANFEQQNGLPADDFLAVYAGNLGVKQGLDVLIEAAPLVRDQRFASLICGDGAQREVLAEQIADLQLPNVTMLPLQAGRELHVAPGRCGSLLHHPTIRLREFVFPSKLLGLLAQSKPVVTVARSGERAGRGVGRKAASG